MSLNQSSICKLTKRNLNLISFLLAFDAAVHVVNVTPFRYGLATVHYCTHVDPLYKSGALILQLLIREIPLVYIFKFLIPKKLFELLIVY